MSYLKLNPQYLRKIQGIYDQLCCQRDSIQTSSQAQQELLSQIADSLGSSAYAVLNLVLTELQNLNLTDFATETTLASILADTTSLDGKDFATEATQQAIDTKLTGVARTPNFIRPTTASNIAVLTYDVAVSNVGLSDGTVLGTTIRPGETLNFNAGALNNFYAAGTFTYDATGTEFIIIYNS